MQVDVGFATTHESVCISPGSNNDVNVGAGLYHHWRML